jgi:hypothetical protein
MADKKTVKIKDLAQFAIPVSISETEQVLLRALTLKEMVQLFIQQQDTFLLLYQAGFEPTVTSLAPFLLTAPDLVAQVIALASDEPEAATTVETTWPGTVQLIALAEVWKMSVPDPKKAKELLSEVMALLQKLNVAANQRVMPTSGVTTSPSVSTS